MEASQVTSSLLQRAVLSLMLIFAVGVFFAPPSHPSHWIVGGLYLLVLFGGVHGAAKRATGWLRFYWVSQFLILVFTLVAIMHGLFLLIAEIRYNRAHPEAAHSSLPEFKNMTKHQLTQFIVINVCYLLTFLMILILKVRSIILAQRLIKQLRELPYAEADMEFEMQEEGEPLYVPQEAAQEETFVPQQPQQQQQQQQQQPVFVMANPQFQGATPFPAGAFAIPPMMPYGQPQYVPMYMDQYGNFITPGQPTENK